MSIEPAFDDRDSRRVLDNDAGTLLVTGAPGTGKSTLLAERFCRLVTGGADPERVLFLTLTRRGREAARRRIVSQLGRSVADLPVLTFHGYALRVLGEHWEALGFERLPTLLTAPEQYRRTSELLRAEAPALWPALDAYRSMKRFAREVADFVLRAQERLLRPPDLAELAERAGRPDLAEVAAFYDRYLDVLEPANEVDFAGALRLAVRAAGEGILTLPEHLLVDDLQDVTSAGGELVARLEAGATTAVLAADPDGRVFSFRGGSGESLDRLQARASVPHLVLEGSHRLAPEVDAVCRSLTADRRDPVEGVERWCFTQPADEADAVARELLREHLERATPWGEMAVILRSLGTYLPVLRRALTHRGVPFVAVGESSVITSEPAVRPIAQLLQFALRPERREELVEALLVSPVVGLHPHDVRALRRAAKLATPPTTVLAVAEGPRALDPEIRARLEAFLGLVADVVRWNDERSPDGVLYEVWRRLPHLAALVEGAERDESDGDAQRDLDALYAFANVVARFAERQGGGATVLEYLDALEEAEFGADPFVLPEERSPDAVRVVTAHRAHGEEFAVAFVVGCIEGQFPQLSSSRPLVDLDDLTGPRSPMDRYRERFREERALFRLAISRGRRLVLTASEARDSRRPRTPTRFLPGPWGDGPADRSPVSLAQAEAEHRRALASNEPAPRRLAALAALAALSARPDTWWGAREWTAGPPLHPGEFKTSYSRLSTLENCALQYLFQQELGLDPSSSHHAWLGGRVHQVIERFWRGEIERTQEAMEADLDAHWRPEAFPSRAVEHRRRLDASEMFRKFLANEAPVEPALVEHQFHFPIDGALLRGRIDAVIATPDGVRILDYKTGRHAIEQQTAKDDLQLGTYLLAARRDDTIRALGNPKRLELVYLVTAAKGLTRRIHEPVPADEARFAGLIESYLERIRAEDFAPNPEAECRYCSFKVICPLWREGAEVAL